jgi:hypothetical protein
MKVQSPSPTSLTAHRSPCRVRACVRTYVPPHSMAWRMASPVFAWRQLSSRARLLAAGGSALGAVALLTSSAGGSNSSAVFCQPLIHQLEGMLERLARVESATSGGQGSLVSIGEALIDFLPRDGADGGGGQFQPVCGGAPFNVALTMARLQAPTVFLSNISADMFGDRICSELCSEGVDLTLVQRVAAPTTLAFVKMEPGCDPQYAFFFREAADRSLTVDSLPELPADTAGMHLSMGAITLETQPVASAFKYLLQHRPGKVFTSFDPNIRDKMIPDATR